jgi:hypothetical protein
MLLKTARLPSKDCDLAERIIDGQHMYLLTRRQLVMDEIHGPNLVRS